MDIKKQELGLTAAAKRSLLRLEGVETLQDLVDMYSEQELFEDQGFKKHSVTYASITECLNTYDMRLYPTFYERKKGLGQLPTTENPRDLLLTDLELPEMLVEKMGHWKYIKTLGDLSDRLEKYGRLHSGFSDDEEALGEFTDGVEVRVNESEELKEILRPKYTRDKVSFLGYPHFKLPEVIGHREVERTEAGWMGFGGGKRYMAKEPIYADAYYKLVLLDLEDRKLLIRTLALYKLYPSHGRLRPALMWPKR